MSGTLLGNGTPVVRAPGGRGFRTKSSRRRTLLRRENAKAQQRRVPPTPTPKVTAWTGELL